MKKRILIITILILIAGVFSAYYYGKSYSEYFLMHEYAKRKANCNTLGNNYTELKNKYNIADSLFILLGDGDIKFEAIDLQSENKNYIILVHGKRECPFAMLRGGLKLYKMGFSVLIPVLYAHGNDSINQIIDYGKYSISQLDNCVDYLLQKKANNIGISGRSMGATLAIIAASRNENITAVAAECPVKSVESSLSYKHLLYSKLPNFPFLNIKTLAVKQLLNDDLDSLNATYFVKRISPRPLFIMSATEDKIVNPKDFDDLFELAGEPKYLWVEAINHTMFHSRLKDEFYIRVPDFFNKAFKEKD